MTLRHTDISKLRKSAAVLMMLGSVLLATPLAVEAQTCTCQGKFTGALVGETSCGIAISRGVNCTWNAAAKSCDCGGQVPKIEGQSKCNAAGVKEAYGLSSIPGVDYSATCEWKAAPAAAATSSAPEETPTRSAQGGLLTGVSPGCSQTGSCQLADFFIVGNNVAKLILGLSGSVMLLMVIYGGFTWLTSGGSSEKIEKGKKILIGSFIGLIIVFGAYTAIQFILGALGVSNVAEIFRRPFGK